MPILDPIDYAELPASTRHGLIDGVGGKLSAQTVKGKSTVLDKGGAIYDRAVENTYAPRTPPGAV